MELLAKLATPLALYLAWAILSNSFFNQVLGFSLSLFLVLLISLIYYQPAPTEAYFLRVLVFSLAVFCVRLLPLVQWLLNSRSSNTRHREGLEVFPSERDDSERDEDSQRLFCADIIAVHGLGSNPDTTWQSRTTVPLEGSSDQEIYPIWLRDFLPQDLQKDGFRVRVMAFNHNTRWKTNALNKSLEDYGQDLLRELAEKRRSVEERSRPIIFIGHSFGGIIVKKALVIARNRGGDDFRCAIAGQTKGIIFMGTPHKGSRLTVFGRLLSVFGHFMGSSTHLLEVIQPSSAVNKDLHTSFLRGYDIKTMVCIFEAVRESFLGFPIMHVVGEDSAVIDGAEKIGLAKTHRELQRAASREDESYKTLRFWIRERVEQTWTNRQRKVHQEPTEITQEEQECLRSLSFEEMNLRRNDVAPASYNTCAWVFDHESYSSWLSQRRGLLWIKGKPGAGKSTLIKYILRQGKFPDDLAIASFYFHGRGAPMQRTPIGLFRSVLHQILIQIRPLLSKFYLVFKKKLESEGVPGKDWVWHERELQDFLELAVTSASKSCSIRIFVDALDECGEKAARDLVSYFRYLTLKLPPTGSALSICFSCRHYPIVVLEHCLEICVEDRNYQDIKTYVREELGELQRGFPKDDVESLQEDIVNRSSGIFQWVSVIARQVLVLQQSGYSLNRIQKELQEKPTELNSLYQEMLKHMPGADRARSLQLMQWICFAERPLSLQELRFAMAFDADSPYRTLCQCQNSTAYIESDEQMKKLVKFLSGGLAEVKELGNRLAAQFIHQSVNDYLIQDGLQSLDNVSGSSVVGRGHHRLARSCIKYFATKEICHWSWEPVQLDNHYIYEFPFLRYAVLSWGTHAERAEAENIPQRDLLDYFQWPSDHILQCWARLHNKVASWSRLSNERPTLLHVASRYSLLSVLIATLKSEVRVLLDVKDGSGQTALLRGAQSGHDSIVKLLIEKGAELDSKDNNGRTALSWATQFKRDSVVELLIGKGAELESRDNDGRTALSLAVESGSDSAAKLLIEKGAELDSKDNGGLTVLSWAAQGGHDSVVKLVVEKGAELESEDNGGRTALSWAARSGHDSVVKLLIEKGAELDSKDNGGLTALSWAAESRYDSVVKLLIEKGSKLDSKDNGGRTALSWAAKSGNDSILKLLIEKGAGLNYKDNGSLTALSRAAKSGYDSVVKLLIEKGAELDSKDNDGLTALSWATRNGHDSVAKLLIEKGAELDSKDNDGRTALSWAAMFGRDSAVKLLIEKGAELESKDKNGLMALSYAATFKHDPVVKLLVEKDAELESKGESGQTALSFAAESGSDSVVKLLIEKGAELDSKDNGGLTALSWATRNGHDSVVKLLIEKGAELGSKDNDGRTALSWAAMFGRDSAVKLLVEKGAELESEDNGGRTALSWATREWNNSTVKLLIEGGARPDP